MTEIKLNIEGMTPDKRKEAVESIIEKEIKTAESELALIKEDVVRFLIDKKGYSVEETERDIEFDVEMEKEKTKSKADIIVNIEGKRLVLIKCSVGALVSRERHALSCARLFEKYQIPFTVVTDGINATVLNTVSGKVIGEGLESIPSKNDLVALNSEIKFEELPPGRVEKEKRILLAFDLIKCSVTHGE